MAGHYFFNSAGQFTTAVSDCAACVGVARTRKRLPPGATSYEQYVLNVVGTENNSDGGDGSREFAEGFKDTTINLLNADT